MDLCPTTSYRYCTKFHAFFHHESEMTIINPTIVRYSQNVATAYGGCIKMIKINKVRREKCPKKAPTPLIKIKEVYKNNQK